MITHCRLVITQIVREGVDAFGRIGKLNVLNLMRRGHSAFVAQISSLATQGSVHLPSS